MKRTIDLNNLNTQLIIAGLTGLIENDGKTFYEAMEYLDAIKNECFPALMQIAREAEAKAKGDVINGGEKMSET